MLLKKSLVALKRLGCTIEEATQLVQKQIRQRCTVRQDLESPLYISDRLRPSKSRSQLLIAIRHFSCERGIDIRLSRSNPSDKELGVFHIDKTENFPFDFGYSALTAKIAEFSKSNIFVSKPRRDNRKESGDHLQP